MPRIAGAAALVTCMVIAFAALGGVGAAQSAGSAAQSEYGKKVTICHKGKTIKVSKHAVRAHLRHGDTLGPCSNSKKAKHKKHKKHHAKAKHAKHAAKAHSEHADKAKDNAKSHSDKSDKGDTSAKGKGHGK